MRAGSGCAAQQTLSAEAASVLKHSLSLSRRRGHSQVTPLHVAATLLSSRSSPLRRACLKSQPPPSHNHHHLSHHHHPLQCRALELCFNVALNRLPATPAPLLSAQPSLSNALVAALKRAQAHQRRGCIEQQQHHQQQQQPLIAVKVELDQLILSILDDPSVSRVMREAGFSSAAVKSNLEDSNVNSVFQCYNTNLSGGIYSTPNSPPTETQNNHPNGGTFWQSHLLSCASDQNPLLFSPQKKPNNDFSSPNEDVKVVMEILLRNNKRKNTVIIVGDSLSMAENVFSEIMEKVERGDVPEELKSAHFIKFQFSSMALRFMKREEVEMNMSDLKRKVDSFASSGGGGGVIIYTGDLKWTVEIDHSDDVDDEKDDGNSNVYRPVDHLILEMGKLLSWYNNNGSSKIRVWLMATANYQTYIKCQTKQPQLDVHWALQAVPIPSGGLGLSLNATSGRDSRINFVKIPSQDSERKPLDEQIEFLTCCPECKSNYEKEASFKSIQHRSFSLQSSNNETENGSAHVPFWLKPHHIETLVKDDLVQLRRKYNKLCHSLHKGSHNSLNKPNSMITNQSYLGKDYNYPSSYSCWPNKNKNSIFSDSETISFAEYPSVIKTNHHHQTASSLPRFRRQQSCHIDFSFSNGTSKYQPVEPNLDSLKGMDDKEVKITLALGNLTYNDHPPSSEDNASLVKLFQENVPWQSETIPPIIEALSPDLKANVGNKFIMIKGNDVIGKRRFAVGIAKFVFGSADLLFCMNIRKNAWDREKMKKALRDHEKLVFLIENVDHADSEFVNFLSEGYERESGHAIFILTTNEERYIHEKSKENVDSTIQMKLLVTNESKSNILDHKRKADWDSPMIKIKTQRNNETDQISMNALDLNVKVDDHDEAKANKPNSPRFLENIKNRYVFSRDSDQDSRAKETLLSKLERAFEEVSSGIVNNLTGFSVEEKVLEEVFRGSGLYLDGLFEQWVREVFKTSLLRLDSGEGEQRVRVRLCLEGEGESCHEEDGFMGTCLPKSILISFTG